MNWTPTADRVLLERTKQKQGLVVLTDADLVREFKVIAIGPKVTDVKVGQLVVLPGIAAEEPDRKLGGYIIVSQQDIGAIVERGYIEGKVGQRLEFDYAIPSSASH